MWVPKGLVLEGLLSTSLPLLNNKLVVDIERDQSPYFGFFRLYFGFHLGLPYEQNWVSGSDVCADENYFYT